MIELLLYDRRQILKYKKKMFIIAPKDPDQEYTNIYTVNVRRKNLDSTSRLLLNYLRTTIDTGTHIYIY